MTAAITASERVALEEARSLEAMRRMKAEDTMEVIRDRFGQPFEPAPEDEWPAPEPLPASLPNVQAFDEALVPSTMRRYVADIADRMQCPQDFPAVSALVVLASIVGRQLGIRPKREDDWLVVPNLWGLVIGRPGVLKTPAILEPLGLIHALEAQARAEHNNAMDEHAAAVIIRKMSAKQTEKAIGKALRDGRDAETIAQTFVNDEPEVPTRRRYITNDATVEKLGELLASNPRGVLVFRDELSGFLANLDREGREGSRAFFLEAWNGTGSFTYDRIGRGTLDIEAACVSILGGIQPGRLSQYVYGAMGGGSDDDGLLQRFSLTVWPDIVGDWANVDRPPDCEARASAKAVIKRLDRINTESLSAQCEDGERVPWLRFSPKAQSIFDQWRAKIELRLRAGKEHPAFEAHLAKYRSLIPSIALLCHLADSPGGGPVSEEALVRALAWAEYLESHARRLYSPALDPGMTAARELNRRVVEGKLPDSFSARDVYRRCWHLLDREGTQSALNILSDFDRVRPERRDTGGRVATTWHVNPRLREGS